MPTHFARTSIARLLALRNRHFLGLDLVLLTFTPLLAFLLRTDGLSTQPAGWDLLSRYATGLVIYTLLGLVVRLLVFQRLGLYRRYWRYASIEELDRIAWAVLLSTLLLLVLVLAARLPLVAVAIPPLYTFPRSLVLIDGLLVLIAVGGIRFSVRLATRWQPDSSGRQVRRVLIMGAGSAGAMIAREMRNNAALGLEPVGFIDDDPVKQKVRIHDIPILGTHADIPTVVQEYKVSQVIIAMPTATGSIIREIVRICDQAGVKAQIMPSLGELLDGRVTMKQVRDVRIEDLLRRAPVQTDGEAVAGLLRGKRVLVTGGGGSIGSELCRQIWRCGPAQLILLGHGENSIFDIHNELLGQEPGIHNQPERNTGPSLIPVIADVRFGERMQQVFAEYRPHVVFHAAAHKHVPLMEMNPAEAITNNVQGTRNVVAAAMAVDVERFVMISTDKAVNPTSIMGVSKRCAEMIVHRAASQSGKPYVAVRFGNVLGSRGSVVLTFQRQIAMGGPVTVTHPEMTRYFMTIPEAVQLVLQSAVLGKGGEVFVLDMGDPVRIADLARDLIELSGLRVGEDIEIIYSGMRPGEKLYEELFIAGEEYARTRHEKIFLAANAGHLVSDGLDDKLAALFTAAKQVDEQAIVDAFRRLVPEFRAVGRSVVGNGRVMVEADATVSSGATNGSGRGLLGK
ncbi:MAG: polysaccharide biosynthesis protein [Caldilineaceae bacterium]|nr:polysaccharide biosynthesis protein [Caldilineaceae bacterium]